MEITNFNVGNFKNYFYGRDVTLTYDVINILLYFLKDTFHRRLQYHKCPICIEMMFFHRVILYILVIYFVTSR